MSKNKANGQGKQPTIPHKNANPLDTQNKGAMSVLEKTTLKAYDEMYGKIQEAHRAFLGLDNKTDKSTILGSELEVVKQIKEAYKDLWEDVEKARNNKLANIVDANANKTSTSTTGSSTVDKYIKEIRDAITSGKVGSASAEGKAKVGNINKREDVSEAQKSIYRTGRQLTDVAEIFTNSLVQGKENQRLIGIGLKSLDGLLDIVANFRDQEKLADSIVGIVVMLLKEIVGFVTDAMMDHYNTQEEIFTNYMVYLKGSDRNLGYLVAEQNFLTRLDELNLENNIRVTELMKTSVDLASKGLSADQAYSNALNSAIYKVIAPALNTTSDIFLDLQTRGLTNITDSMAGIVESVRSTAGSSRVALTALNTVVDKLGPVELYAQKELLSGDAAQMLSDLEQMGYTTSDAMEIVNTVLDSFTDPYKILSGGSPIGKIIAEQYASGNITTLTQGLGVYQNVLDSYFSGLSENDIVDRSAVLSGLGANISPWIRQTGDGGKEKVEDPLDKYKEMLSKFSGDEYQTFNELQTIAVTNSDLAMGMNTYVREIGEHLRTITDAVVDIADTLVGDREERRKINNAYNTAVDTARSDKTTVGKLTALSQLSEALSLEYNATGTSTERKEELMAQYATIQGEYAKYKSWLSPQEKEQLIGLSKLKTLTEQEKAMLQVTGADSIEDLPKLAARGAYLTKATPLIAGEAGPEFVIPEQKLIDTIGEGFEQYFTNNNTTPDYSAIVNAIYMVASEIVDAIEKNGGNANLPKFDTTTGLMSTATNLSPIMGKR